jgi:MFS family permease
MESSEPLSVEGRWGEVLQAPYFLALVTLALGVALFAFNTFFVITALPTAVDDLDGIATITWATSLYLIFGIASGAAAGLAKVRFGARPVFFVATIVFIAGTIMTGLAPDMTVLLAGRGLQGAGVGMIEGMSYAMIPVLFPARLVPKVFGVEAVMWVLAAFGGPAVAGFLTVHMSWRIALMSSLPLAVLFIVLVMRVVPKEIPTLGATRFPGMRLGLIASGLLLVMLSSVYPAMQALMFNIAAVVLIVCGFLADRQSKDRLFPRKAFTLSLPFGLGLWVVVLMAIPESSVSAFLPYSIQHAWGYSPAYAGAVHSLLAIGWSFSQLFIATFVSASMRRELIWVGPILLAAGLFVMSAGVASSSLLMIVFAQICIGTAFGINWGSISELLMHSVPTDEQAQASSLLPTTQSGGFALGASLSGLTGNLLGIAGATSAGDIRQILSQVFLISAIAALPSIPLAWAVVRCGTKR